MELGYIAVTVNVDETHPDITYDGQDTYLITWQRFDSPVVSVRAQSQDFAANTYEYFDVASDAILPVVAAGASQFLVAYQGIYPSGGSEYKHIFGRYLYEFFETTCTPLTGLTVTGPTVGQIGSSHIFQVDNLAPLNVTFPIIYTWSPTPDNQSGNSATYSWSTAGVNTITATGSNCAGSGSAKDDHTITINAACTPLTGLTVTGPTTGQTGSSYIFQVDNLAPLNVTFPIIYTWSPTPANQSGNSATYSWSTEGVKTITVTGSNCAGGGSASDNHTITISAAGNGVKLYLPLTMRPK